MNLFALYFICCTFGYLLGSFPTGVVLSKRRYLIDVRELGSGNIGATNVTRVFGWYAGLLTFAIDFLKGWLPVSGLLYTFPEYPWLATLTGSCLVLGHCYSLYLKFHGGKGVATSFGILVAVLPWAALIAGAVYATLLIATRISSVGSLSGLTAALLTTAFLKPQPPALVLIFAMCSVVAYRHKHNIKRLIHDFRDKQRRQNT
ncbi:MAG: glycerol-3-phosphate 1-O-acyltransferase PlsY [Deltaproteobacteria bacterium]|nr:glycerol-3-phosphate 1-O-acyltransferase PlsY [Deltaproteobacteria bacterium]